MVKGDWAFTFVRWKEKALSTRHVIINTTGNSVILSRCAQIEVAEANELAVSPHSALHDHHHLSSMNRSKDYPGFWHAVLLCVIFIALQLVLIIPVAIFDAVFKTRLVAHPAVLGLVNLIACALVVTTGWLIGRPAMSEVCALRRVSGPALGSVIVASAGAIILLSEADNLVRLILPAPDWIVRIFNELSAPSEHF